MLALLASTALVGVAAAPLASAATTTVFVSPGGTDSGTCGASSATACATIAQAVTNAAATDAGAPLVIQLAVGTYNETSTTSLLATSLGTEPSSISVLGGDTTAAHTIIDGGGAASNFSMFSFDGTVAFNNLTLQHGHIVGDGGAITQLGANPSNLTLANDVVSNNAVSGSNTDGGAVRVDGSTSIVTLTNDTFDHDTVGTTDGGHGGGALAFEAAAGTLIVSGTTFSNDSVIGGCNGGGGAIIADGLTVNITTSTFSNDSACHGGAIRFEGGVATTGSINTTTFSNDSGVRGDTQGGGAILANNNGGLTFTGDTFSADSDPTGPGGAVALYGNSASATSSVSNSTFTGDTASSGGAIYSQTGVLDVSGSTFTNDAAPGGFGGAVDATSDASTDIETSQFTTDSAANGGAIINANAGAMTLGADTFTGNTATAEGGAVFTNAPPVNITSGTFTNNSGLSGGALGNAGTMSVTKSTFAGNSAPSGGRGGAVFTSGTFTVSDSTLTQNSAPTGGAVSVNGGTFSALDDTLTANSATTAGGAIAVAAGAATVNFVTFSKDSTATVAALAQSGGSLTVADSILSETLSCAGTITDGHFNAESDNSCGFGATDVTGSASLHVAAALAANGSSGPLTLAVDSSSSALNLVPLASCTGVNGGTDERGVARPGIAGNLCTAGAFELGASLVITQAPPAMIVTGATFPVQVSVENANGSVDTTNNTTQVTLDLSTNPQTANLTCTPNPVTVVNGVATFSCTIDKSGGPDVITASAIGLPAAATGSFTVAPGAGSPLANPGVAALALGLIGLLGLALATRRRMRVA